MKAADRAVLSQPESPLRDTYAPSLIEFLRDLGAEHVRHGDRAFLEHLIGTARFLETWGADDDVCRAGLFHSIYGTESFERPLLSFDERPRVVELIGERAERLAYAFCRLDPHLLFQAVASGEPYFVDLPAGAGRLPITKRDLADLLSIFWANALEQLRRHRLTPEARLQSLSAIELSRPFLSVVTYVEIRQSYDAAPTEEQATSVEGSLCGVELGRHTSPMHDVVVVDPFRTPIVLKQWMDCEPMNSELFAAILARMDSRGIEASNRGGWHSADNLAEWQEPCVEVLFRRAQEMSEVFVDEIMQIPRETYRFEWKFSAWCVVNRTGDYNVPHNHTNAAWSGVYYVRADPPPPEKPYAGCIEFQDPRGGISAAKPAAMYGHLWHRVLPRPGLMLVFPGWMQHFVHPHDGHAERVAISFDAILTDENYDFETIRRARNEGRLGRQAVR